MNFNKHATAVDEWGGRAYMWRMMILWLFLSAFANAQNLELVGPTKSVTVTLAQLKKQLQVHTIKIDAPLAKAAKDYDGFLLDDVVALVSARESAHDEIIFTSADGYAPNTSQDLLKAHKGYLVFQEHGKKPGFLEKVPQGKAMVSPGPYYLLWAEGRAVAREMPWPYQLKKIEVVSFAKKFPKLYSSGGDTSVMNGFKTFKDRCVRCHSINLEGGDVGPELNIPKNVTEYWKPEVLKDFIPHPSRYRARSKMPDSPDFTPAQVDDIIAYLRWMKGR